MRMLEMDQKLIKISQMKQLLQISSSCRSPVFRRDVRKLLNDDEALFRWLEAHHDSPRLATLMLFQTLYWRITHNVDSILEENYLALFSTTFPISFGNYDNFGRPVMYIPLKRWKIEEIPKLYETGEFLRFVISIFETVSDEIRVQSMKRMNRELRVLKPSLCKFSVVINAEGVTARPFLNFKVIRSFFLFSKTLEAHYPGTLLRCLFVNCGDSLSKTIFRFLMRPSFWRACRMSNTSVTATTTTTVQFFSRHSNWIDALRSIIPSEELPLEFGGWKQLELCKDENIGDNHYHQNNNDESLLVNQYI